MIESNFEHAMDEHLHDQELIDKAEQIFWSMADDWTDAQAVAILTRALAYELKRLDCPSVTDSALSFLLQDVIVGKSYQ
jgi:hypothetical protein